MYEVPRDEGSFGMQAGTGSFMKSEFFKFPHVSGKIVRHEDGSRKAEIRGESWRTLRATIVGIIHGCTIDSA
jgi:hypothetical protein